MLTIYLTSVATEWVAVSMTNRHMGEVIICAGSRHGV